MDEDQAFDMETNALRQLREREMNNATEEQQAHWFAPGNKVIVIGEHPSLKNYFMTQAVVLDYDAKNKRWSEITTINSCQIF